MALKPSCHCCELDLETQLTDRSRLRDGAVNELLPSLRHSAAEVINNDRESVQAMTCIGIGLNNVEADRAVSLHVDHLSTRLRNRSSECIALTLLGKPRYEGSCMSLNQDLGPNIQLHHRRCK